MSGGHTRGRAVARRLLLVAGCACVAVGLVGVVVPVLPTTPFLLVAAFCFARSSRRFHRWLLGNRVFGRYLRSYLEGRGLPVYAKLFTICLLWSGILVSVFFLLHHGVARILLLAVGVAVTAHVALIRARAKEPEPARSPAPGQSPARGQSPAPAQSPAPGQSPAPAQSPVAAPHREVTRTTLSER